MEESLWPMFITGSSSTTADGPTKPGTSSRNATPPMTKHARLQRRAAAEQRLPGATEDIEYQDEAGDWHEEVSQGKDRPETDVTG